MRLRSPLLSVLLLLAVVAPMSGAHADTDPAADDGRFYSPFREDGAPYDAAANTFGGERGDTGCLPADDKGHKDCLPAGASENVLADGRVLYWNAIEGAEDLDQPTEAVVPYGGDLARNDRSRVLSLDWADHTGANWLAPTNDTAYFPAPTEPPLIPGTDNANPDQTYNNDGSLFCSDQKQLADGRILAAGGTNYYAEPRLDETHGVIELEGVRNARIFDPADNRWKPTGSLNYGRWYPSMVTLADGDIFVASGVTKLIKPLYPNKDPKYSGDNVPQTETYDVATGTWADNGATAERSLPLFPRLHLLPNGHVYYDAAGQAFNPMGQSYRQAFWNMAASYDPAAKEWLDLGVPGLSAGELASADGDYAEPGFRGSTFSQALPYRPDKTSGEYTSGSFLTAGGVTLMSPGSYLPTDTTRIDTVHVDGDSDTLVTTPAGKLGRPRWYSSAVTLPTGQVLAFSGADVDEVVSPGHESPIRQAELFTPTTDDDGNYTGGSWQDVAVANRRRTYHNNAVLLPDGRVLVGGHAPIPNSYYYVNNDSDLAPSVRPASNNYKDASFEIYEPPYLHWGVSRPVIGNMNPDIATGRELLIPTDDPDSIASVVLVRNPAETHLIDADQRVVELPVTKRDGSSLHVAVTANKAVLPPGPYMLFLNKRAGENRLVPSVARQMFVDVQVPGWARGAETYPDDEAAATPPSPTPIGTGLVIDGPPPKQPGDLLPSVPAVTGTGTDLATTAVASDRPRRSSAVPVLVAVLAGAVVLGGGLRRRRTRIQE